MDGRTNRTESVNAELKAIAIMAIRYGVPIFPCGGNKAPLIKGWQTEASSDNNKLINWYKTQSQLRYWGMPTGRFIAIDQDGPNFGEVKESWLSGNPYKQRTRSGGNHWLYLNPDGHIRNRARFTGDLDIRGTGGYICLYSPIFNEFLKPAGVPTIPKDLLILINNKSVKAKAENWSEGARNETLNRLIFTDLKHNGGRGIPEIKKRAEASGLKPQEIETTVRSAIAGAISKPKPKRVYKQAPVKVAEKKTPIKDTEAEAFIVGAIKVCKEAEIKAHLVPQFISFIIQEYFDYKVDFDFIKVKVQEADLSGGFFVPYIVPSSINYALEFKRVFNILGFEGRWNVFKDRIEFRKNGDKRWRDFEDADKKNFYNDIESKALGAVIVKGMQGELKIKFKNRFSHKSKAGFLSPSRFKDYASVEIFENNRVNPFQEYLDSMPQWDGEKRLSTAIQTAFRIDEPHVPLSQWFTECFLTAVVKRTYQPGCKFDLMMILAGGQGIGKSSFFTYFFPKEIEKEYFSDQNPFHPGSKREGELLRYAVIELAELSKWTEKGIDFLKQKLTSRVDRIQGMYARKAKPLPRQAVFVGTTNKDKFLPDDEENRRFVPLYVKRLFECDKCRGLNIRCLICEKPSYQAIEKFMNENRKQLWAEAIHLWQNKYKLIEPDGINEILISKRDEAKEIDSALQEAVFEAVIHLKEGGEPENIKQWTDKDGNIKEKGRMTTTTDKGTKHFKMGDLMDCMGEAHVRYKNARDSWFQRQIGQVLRQAGFKTKQKRILGHSGRWWWYEETGSPLDVKF